jgi:methionyl-tRNA synthetase
MKLADQEAGVGDDLYAVLEASRWVAVLLAPLVPDLSARMLRQLGLEPFPSGTQAAAPMAAAIPAPAPTAPPAWLAAQRWGLLLPGQPLPEPEPVLLRLELDAPL